MRSDPKLDSDPNLDPKFPEKSDPNPDPNPNPDPIKNNFGSKTLVLWIPTKLFFWDPGFQIVSDPVPDPACQIIQIIPDPDPAVTMNRHISFFNS